MAIPRLTVYHSQDRSRISRQVSDCAPSRIDRTTARLRLDRVQARMDSARAVMASRPHMRKVRSVDTAPECALRKLLNLWGFTGYRLYRSDLPGKPDIAYIRRRKAIFLHGCFWHCHNCRAGRNVPQTNLSYWMPKLARNKSRDRANLRRLRSMGWGVLVVWECQLKRPDSVRQRVTEYLCV